jgi:hypothetical protein
MLNAHDEEFNHNRERLLANYPFPANLRERTNFKKQIDLWQNEKMLFPWLPVELQLDCMAANFRTLEDMGFDLTGEIKMKAQHQEESKMPPEISMKGYQHSGYFCQAPMVSNVPAAPCTIFQYAN